MGQRAPVMDYDHTKPPLEQGTLIESFNSKPPKEKVDALAYGEPVENVKGQMLSEDVKSGRYDTTSNGIIIIKCYYMSW